MFIETDIHFRAVHRLDAAGLHSLIVLGREQVVHGRILKHILTVHFFNHVAGRLAFAEAGNIVFASLALIGLGDGIVERSRVDGKLQLVLIFFKLFTFYEIHFVSSIK